MKLGLSQLSSYRNNGYLLLPNAIPEHRLEAVSEALTGELRASGPHIVYEEDGSSIRSVYGSHRTNDTFRELTSWRTLLGPACQLIGEKLYVYQLKVNLKSAHTGDGWDWHQDYAFWCHEDGMPTPTAITAVVYLDEVTSANGAFRLIPGSHKHGLYATPASTDARGPERERSQRSDWPSHVSRKLKYAIPHDTIKRLSLLRGVVDACGPRGTVLLFDPNLVHGSPANTSASRRALVFVTYNSVRNLPNSSLPGRPEFLVSKDHRAVGLSEG